VGHNLAAGQPYAVRITVSICALFASQAGAADRPEAQFAVGIKTWANEWTSWDPIPSGHNTIRIIESVGSSTHWSVIPQASVRYGNWLAAASYFVNSDYTLGGRVDPSIGTVGALSASRHEVDGNVGYYVLQGLAVTLGYKQIEQKFGPDRYKWTGPTVGLAASAPMQGALSLYGTFAYGRLQLNASTSDDSGESTFHSDYLLGEVGLSYGFNTPLHTSLSIIAGYRVQSVSTRRFNVSTGFSGYAPVDVHDTTQGPVVSVLARF
jgi:hypothetical protein